MPSTATHEQIRRKNIRKAGRMRWPEERTWLDEVDELLEETRDPDPAVRREALHRLCPCTLKANDARAWDRILQMVADEDPKVRAQVLHTLADGSPREREPDVAAAIERMQHDPDPKLRRRVRKLLAHYRAGGRINIL